MTTADTQVGCDTRNAMAAAEPVQHGPRQGDPPSHLFPQHSEQHQNPRSPHPVDPRTHQSLH